MPNVNRALHPNTADLLATRAYATPSRETIPSRGTDLGGGMSTVIVGACFFDGGGSKCSVDVAFADFSAINILKPLG